MENERQLFLHTRYLGTSANRFPLYYNNNGVMKRYLPSIFSKRVVKSENLWCKLTDLPLEYQEELSHMANTPEEIRRETAKNSGVYDRDNVIVYIDNETLLLPVVGRILATDGSYAYTVKLDGNKPVLESILVCWNCHWADLFSGNSKYGENVFCLFSDLSKEQRESFANETIPLKDVPSYLGLEPRLEEKKMSLNKKKRKQK